MRSVALSEVIEDARSGFASGKDEQSGVVQIRMNNVTTDGRLIWDKLRRVPAPKNIEPLLIRPGDILFNATNSPDLVGKSALFLGHSEPVTFSNHFIRLRVNTSKASPGFISRVLQDRWSKRIFCGMCKQWVNQASVTKGDLLSLAVPLPPLDEQKRIAAILDQADNLRRLRQRALHRLNELGQAIFYEMFGDGRRSTGLRLAGFATFGKSVSSRMARALAQAKDKQRPQPAEAPHLSELAICIGVTRGRIPSERAGRITCDGRTHSLSLAIT